MELLSNGKVLIKTANTEMGQGVDTAYKIIVSEKLHLPFEDIIIEEKIQARCRIVVQQLLPAAL